MSNSKQTKHIKEKYYLVKDKTYNNELEVKHRLNDVMWSDVLNKPKQVTHFRLLPGVWMDVSENYDENE